MPSATPADVLARRSQLILNGDADGFAALFATDAVIESSFAGPPGTPVRLEGREAICEYSRRVISVRPNMCADQVSGHVWRADPVVQAADDQHVAAHPGDFSHRIEGADRA